VGIEVLLQQVPEDKHQNAAIAGVASLPGGELPVPALTLQDIFQYRAVGPDDPPGGRVRLGAGDQQAGEVQGVPAIGNRRRQHRHGVPLAPVTRSDVVSDVPTAPCEFGG
jgi:hypothetical protein